ncbi:MAG: ABC transporter permease [Pikeienuella sp.]|uniref:ABC transporter permease n=1 Tax=Pikeienuella sp. TaxID=2831957 RepID=UPI0039189DFD
MRRALFNSLESAALSALFATIAGAALALLVGLTDIRAKGPLAFLILLPLMIPPHVTAIAWLQALGPASPLLLALGLAPPPGSPNPMHSAAGLIALLSAQHAPLAFLTVRAALRALPREMAEAARLAGAGFGRVLFRIVLPLVAPALLAGFALSFTAALGNFGVNAIIGIPARYDTLPVLIWRRLTSFGPDMLGSVAVIALLISLVALGALAFQLFAQRRFGAALSGPPQPPLAQPLGRWRAPAEAATWLLVGATLILPLSALLATALSPTYGAPLNAETVTLRHFAEILFRQEATARAFLNSTLIASAAALLIAALAIGLGHFMSRGGRAARRLASLAAGQAEIAYAVPGLVVSVAFIIAFIRPLPLLGVSLYNTLWIILLAYLAAFLAIGLKPVLAAFAAVDPSLDDAARVSGAGFGRRLLRISAPLVLPAAASGALLVFLTAYNEVTVSALLWSSGAETIGATIFNLEDGGATSLAAAMAAVTVGATALLMLALDRLGRGAPPGVVPWR